MKDKELAEELKKLSATMKGLTDQWSKAGLPDNIEEAIAEIQSFIKWVETTRPEIKKAREKLLAKFPHLRNIEGIE